MKKWHFSFFIKCPLPWTSQIAFGLADWTTLFLTGQVESWRVAETTTLLIHFIIRFSCLSFLFSGEFCKISVFFSPQHHGLYEVFLKLICPQQGLPRLWFPLPLWSPNYFFTAFYNLVGAELFFKSIWNS